MHTCIDSLYIYSYVIQPVGINACMYRPLYTLASIQVLLKVPNQLVIVMATFMKILFIVSCTLITNEMCIILALLYSTHMQCVVYMQPVSFL